MLIEEVILLISVWMIWVGVSEWGWCRTSAGGRYCFGIAGGPADGFGIRYRITILLTGLL